MGLVQRRLLDFVQHISGNLSASAGPRYLGLVTGGTTPAAMLADWITSATDQNVCLPGDSIATAVEVQALSWLRQLFQIDETFQEPLRVERLQPIYWEHSVVVSLPENNRESILPPMGYKVLK